MGREIRSSAREGKIEFAVEFSQTNLSGLGATHLKDLRSRIDRFCMTPSLRREGMAFFGYPAARKGEQLSLQELRGLQRKTKELLLAVGKTQVLARDLRAGEFVEAGLVDQLLHSIGVQGTTVLMYAWTGSQN